MKTLYFGILSEITGKPSEDLDFTGHVGQLRALLAEKYPQISAHSFQIAVDQKISPEDQELHQTSEVALLPPFTGG